MSTTTFALMMLSLVLISSVIAGLGAYFGHNGLFEIGGEGFKTALAAAAGAYAGSMTKSG